MYCPSDPPTPGCGPRGLDWDVRPLPAMTRMRLPSEVKRVPVGYQPTGRKPFTRDSRDATLTTATVLLSAFATRSVPPSGESPRALGVLPAGAFGSRAIEIRSVTFREARSTAQTAFVLAQATKTEAPSRESTMAAGCSPTSTSPWTARLAGSTSRIREPPQSETRRVFPSFDRRHVYGSAGSVTTRSTRPDSRSTAESVSSSGLTMKSRRPSAETSRPARKLVVSFSPSAMRFSFSSFRSFQRKTSIALSLPADE